MLGLGLDTWNNLLIIFLLVAAAFGLLAGGATYCVVRLQRAETEREAREFAAYKVSAKHDAEVEIGKARADADSKIGATRADADVKIKAARDDAELKIADANRKAAQAVERAVQLRTDVGPRHLDTPKLRKAIEGMPHKAPVEILFDENSPDAPILAVQIYVGLRTSGWQASQPALIPPDTQPGVSPSLPKHFVLGMQAWGMSVLTREQVGELAGTRNALGSALQSSIIPGQVMGFDANEYVPPGVIRVLIGPRPY
jgi:hypothetical protein